MEVTGRLDPGGFSPYLIVDSFDRVGEGPLPACRSFDHDRFFSGADDCTLVEVTGVVQAIRPFGSTSWRAMLETQGRSFIVDIKKTAVESDLSGLVDATVRVRGPTVSIFNTRVETDHTSVDMANVVHNALLRCRQEFGRIGVAVETAGLDPLEVSGDAVQLQGVVVNLLRNAIDAVADLPPDRRRVRVELRRELVPVEGDDPQADAAACRCLVVVGDSGPGLPREVVDRMPLHTTKPHGSGLGLFLVGAVAENHAGRLEVGRSSLGGAEVRIVLPSRG